MRERIDMKSPVREYRPPGSVRGAPGNRRPHLDNVGRSTLLIGISDIVSVPISGCRSRLGSPDRRLDRSPGQEFGRPNCVSVPKFPRRLSNVTLRRPQCWDHTARCQRSRYGQIEQTRSLKISANISVARDPKCELEKTTERSRAAAAIELQQRSYW